MQPDNDLGQEKSPARTFCLYCRRPLSIDSARQVCDRCTDQVQRYHPPITDTQRVVLLSRELGVDLPELRLFRTNTIGYQSSEGKVVALNCSNQSIQVLPVIIGDLRHLQTLILGGNLIRDVPRDVFQKLGQLALLELSNNNITDVPDELGNLKRLKTLLLSQNKLIQIPQPIQELPELTHLDLSRNSITTLPALPSMLRYLNLDHNRLKKVFDTNQSLLEKLGTLKLENNDLEVLGGDEVAIMPNIRELHTGFNRLVTVPAEVGKLKHLQVLNVEHNNLKSIPTELGHLTKLRTLTLNNNELEWLPATISGLTGLQELFLQDNLLTELPPSITQLQSLKRVWLRGNALDKKEPLVRELQAKGCVVIT